MTARAQCFRTDGPPGCKGGVHVVNARTGRRRAYRRPGSSRGGAGDVELHRGGTVAWVWRLEGGDLEIRRGARGRQAVVASGTGVEPRSLALARRRLYWMQDGAPRTAVLP